MALEKPALPVTGAADTWALMVLARSLSRVGTERASAGEMSTSRTASSTSNDSCTVNAVDSPLATVHFVGLQPRIDKEGHASGMRTRATR